ncbi:trans-alpha-bergamotene synthase-like isoform X2 [Andrographis paniculata]|uniref:trans-alpha-bergamotene synthase-like isoform X2 n=1 Tax=Andrographis paniculata TaxID=175694 RepID=UPI0021E95DB3|nr:trans-alpha-bergamotene synthase-like isoform X2 [Andrographis paniculata]QJA18326.1 terpene synthase 11 [Andrographis paniculata]
MHVINNWGVIIKIREIQEKELVEQAEKLKWLVQVMIDAAEHLSDKLDLIDTLQRLDLSNQFSDAVGRLLDDIFANYNNQDSNGFIVLQENLDLHITALQFRLLRQHGHHVPQEVFRSFMDEVGNFKESLGGDVKGMLSLYEASFLCVEGEAILDLAKDFATRHLKKKLEETRNAILVDEIRHALEVPLHWRVQKLEARWFIQVYETRPDANPILVRLAKLNYNMVQAKYQDEIKYLSRWYKETCLTEKLGFARHRLAEGFLWALGFSPDPEFAFSRRVLCKIAVLITVMDDIYDLYGTLDELQALTDTIQRWDINGLDKLPEYMQISFLALFNSANEMAYDVMKDQGLNIISHLRKLWAEMSESFNVEARWYHKRHFPSVDEYLNLGWISAPGPLVLLYAYLSVVHPIDDDKELAYLQQYPGIIFWPSMVLRLTNDLATASGEMEKGDAPSSMECYMRETGCSEEEARRHIKQLIEVALKKMNKEIVMEKGVRNNENNNYLTEVDHRFCKSAMNLARIALCVYQFGDGDGMGAPHGETKRNLISLVVDPIPTPADDDDATC